MLQEGENAGSGLVRSPRHVQGPVSGRTCGRAASLDLTKKRESRAFNNAFYLAQCRQCQASHPRVVTSRNTLT